MRPATDSGGGEETGRAANRGRGRSIPPPSCPRRAAVAAGGEAMAAAAAPPKEVQMSTASHTTQGSQSLRPAAIAAVFAPAVASIPGDMSSGAYAALHPAPAAVAPGAPNRVVGLSEATGLEHANGGNGTGATGSAGVGEATGIPYEGTGRAADLIRGGYSGGTEGPVVAPAAVASTGIPYEGTG